MATLTEQQFWDAQWASARVPIDMDERVYYHRALARLLRDHFKPAPKRTVLEIGCAPGQYLVFFARELGFIPHGIDYSVKGVELTRQNLAAFGIKGNIVNGDLCTYVFKEQFDLVFSCGFIEHFSGVTLEQIIKRHIALVKPGGSLCIIVPNLRYINYALMHFVAPKVLEGHNLDTMSIRYFRDVAQVQGLTMRYIGYFGGFSPASFKFKTELHQWIKPLWTKLRSGMIALRQAEIGDRINSPLFSFFLGAIMEKPLNHA